MKFLSNALSAVSGRFTTAEKSKQPPGIICIDLGTANALVHANGEFGCILVEDLVQKETRSVSHIRTIVARKGRAEEMDDFQRRIDKERGRADMRTPDEDLDLDIEAVGQDAFEMWGRAPRLIFDRAVKRGNIANIRAYRAVMRYLIAMVHPEFKWCFPESSPKPKIFIGVPDSADKYHLSAVRGVIERNLKADAITVIEQIASVVGAKLKGGGTIPYLQPASVAIADLGGGTLDFAVLNHCQVVDRVSYETAGDEMDLAIIDCLRKGPHFIDIGFRTAIEIKEALGSAIPREEDDEKPYEVYGAKFQQEQPGSTTVTPKVIRECLMPVLQVIVNDFRRYLQRLKNHGEVHADIMQNGFYITGGASLLYGFDQYLAREMGLPIKPVENAMTSVIDGLVIMSENHKLLELGLAK
ncbi:MAG: rod shape-determining protein [Candidatus Doudnabacteria bacterium]|nr:rod shape-determining protein [Candidatus Doudnabacteria bacterium]